MTNESLRIPRNRLAERNDDFSYNCAMTITMHRDASFYVVATLEPSRSRRAEGAECWSAGAFNEARDHVLLLLLLSFFSSTWPSSLSVLFLACRSPSRFFRLRGLPSPMTGNEDYYGTGVTCSRSAGFERIAFRSGFRSAPRLSPSRDLGLAEVRSRFNVT